MVTTNRLRLTRNQLASLTKDAEIIKQLEKLVAVVNDGPIVERKADDTSRASTTVLADDPELAAEVSPGVYVFTGVLFFTMTTNCGLKVAIDGTATVSSMKVQASVFDSAAEESVRLVALGDVVAHGAAHSGDHYVMMDGIIVVTVDGTLRIQWAQNSSNVSPLLLQRDSYIELVRASP